MADQTVKVWDPLVRVFHWSLVASFAVALVTADEWEGLHEWAGYAAAALIGFRIVWGLVGPKYARFSQFVRSPGAVADYLRSLVSGRERRYLGHNPAGGVMIVALILATTATALTGWMTTLPAYHGAEWVEEGHEVMANLMLVMVLLHVAGVVLAGLRHRENLVRAMIVGRKRAPEAADVT
jgi:cytochrome b